jgi:L-rhamnose mutarotase
MERVHNSDSYINVPLSQTHRSYLRVETWKHVTLSSAYYLHLIRAVRGTYSSQNLRFFLPKLIASCGSTRRSIQKLDYNHQHYRHWPSMCSVRHEHHVEAYLPFLETSGSFYQRKRETGATLTALKARFQDLCGDAKQATFIKTCMPIQRQSCIGI